MFNSPYTRVLTNNIRCFCGHCLAGASYLQEIQLCTKGKATVFAQENARLLHLKAKLTLLTQEN
jgi:hypothetical protein